MNVQTKVKTQNVNQLAGRWQAYKAANPNVRIRNAAKELGVSEGELVATACGTTATRIDAQWGELLKELPELGEVLVITRNDNAVHEKKGKFDNISIDPEHGLVLNREIDLRIFFGHWHYGFAVIEDTRRGLRHSLQFFDQTGMSVHKVYLTENSNKAAYDKIVTQYRADDQVPLISPAKASGIKDERTDSEIDVKALQDDWRALRDTHDFLSFLRKFDVTRTQALRLAGKDLASPVSIEAFERTLVGAAKTGLPIMIFVGNRGCLQIHTGPIKKIVKTQGWLNILDPGFDLHVLEDSIAQAWVVRKPTRDGIVTSLELFDQNGQEILLMFGERKPGIKELPEWTSLAESLVNS